MTKRFLAQAVILRCTKNAIDFPWVLENLNSLPTEHNSAAIFPNFTSYQP